MRRVGRSGPLSNGSAQCPQMALYRPSPGRGVLAAHGVPVAFLTPPMWKRLVGIPPGKAGAKDAARSEAIRRWPAVAALFAGAKDDGPAGEASVTERRDRDHVYILRNEQHASARYVLGRL